MFNKMKWIIMMMLVLMVSINAQDKKTIAVLDFDANGISESDVRSLTNRVANLLFRSNKFELIERGKMDQIMEEQGIQLTGCTSDECVVEMGQLLGAELMLAGSIGLVGKTFTVDLRIIDIETGKIAATAYSDLTGEIDDLLTRGLKTAVDELIQNSNTQANIQIITQPAGAEIFVDGESKGLSPLNLMGISSSQTHDLKIMYVGYEPYNETLQLVRGDNPVKSIKLEISKGLLSVNGFPKGSQIFLDDTFLAKDSILNYELTTGNYLVKVKKPEFYISEESVSIIANQETSFYYDLKPISKGKSALFSLAFPGAGQMYQGYKVKGISFVAVGVSLVAYSFSTQVAYQTAYDDYLVAAEEYESAVTDIEPKRIKANEALQTYYDAEDTRNVSFGLLGGFWTLNLIEIFF